MKNPTKLTFALIILAAVVVIAIVAFSMQNDDQTKKDKDRTEWDQHTPLSAKTEMEIKQDYLEFYTKIHTPDATVDDVMVWKYYGTNGSCFAVMMTDRFTWYTTALETEVVDGITIHYGSSNKILVWEDGSFHRLQEAYDMGLLTKDNLIAISNISFHD